MTITAHCPDCGSQLERWALSDSYFCTHCELSFEVMISRPGEQRADEEIGDFLKHRFIMERIGQACRTNTNLG